MNKRLVVASGVLAIGLVAAVHAVRSRRPAPRIMNTQSTPADARARPRPRESGYGKEADAQAVALLAAHLPDALRVSGVSARIADSLAEQTVRLLESYLTNDVELFLQHMPARGLEILPEWLEDKQRLESLFDQTNSLASALVRDQPPEVRWLWRQGVEQSVPAHTSSTCTSRTRLPEEVDNPKEDRLDVIEVLLAVTTPDAEKRYFDATLGITATFNRRTGQWVIHKLCLYDMASDDFVLLPPI